MTAEVRFDNGRYAELLAETLPKRIETEEENERVLEVLAASFNRDDLTAEEEALVGLLTALVEDFEAKHYELPRTAPDRALRLLMEERGVQQRDLLEIFGSRGHASDVVSGKRGLSKGLAKRLGAYFRVPADLFL
jgi:HTH-type transcriptional regulator / antitoxin HigA